MLRMSAKDFWSAKDGSELGASEHHRRSFRATLRRQRTGGTPSTLARDVSARIPLVDRTLLKTACRDRSAPPETPVRWAEGRLHETRLTAKARRREQNVPRRLREERPAVRGILSASRLAPRERREIVSGEMVSICWKGGARRAQGKPAALERSWPGLKRHKMRVDGQGQEMGEVGFQSLLKAPCRVKRSCTRGSQKVSVNGSGQ